MLSWIRALLAAALATSCRSEPVPAPGPGDTRAGISPGGAPSSDVPLEPAKESVLSYLREHARDRRPLGFVVYYEANSPTAAERLADWWRNRSGTIVQIRLVPPTSDAERRAALENVHKGAPGRRVYVALQNDTTWSVQVQTTPKPLDASDVDTWFSLVSHAPRDSAWYRKLMSLNDGGTP